MFDLSNGMTSVTPKTTNSGRKWVNIFTGHFCERYAERIMNCEKPTFQLGSEEIMFSDLLGPVRVTEKIADGLEEIEFQSRKARHTDIVMPAAELPFLKLCIQMTC
jgi:hypothetical protein